MASLYPFAWLVQRIGGDHIRMESLAKPGADPHDLELTPRQVIDVADARLVVYVGDLQPAVDDAVNKYAHRHALDAASVVRTRPEAGEEAHGVYDPHVWLDPIRFATIARAVEKRLAAIDPAHAGAYRHRAASVIGELRTLDGAYRSGLRTCRTRTLVTSHAAFGYLADRYDLHQVGIAGVDPEIAPSLRRLAVVTRVARRAHVTVVFYEASSNGEIARALADDIGARARPLDPVEVAPGHGGYLSLMRGNLAALEKALGC